LGELPMIFAALRRRVHLRGRLKSIPARLRYPELRHALATFSHLTAEERVTLYRLAHGRTTIVEIGSYLGASACCFGAALKKQGFGCVYCVDTWANDAMDDGKWDTFAEFTANTAPFAQRIVPVRGMSADVASRIREPIDLLFIDGDHSYEGVKADWAAYAPLLAPGATVVFHDYVAWSIATSLRWPAAPTRSQTCGGAVFTPATPPDARCTYPTRPGHSGGTSAANPCLGAHHQ